MKITKHGDKYKKEPNLEEFKCKNCGCEFSAKDDEYYTDTSPFITDQGISLNYTISCSHEDWLVCSCPECHKIVKKSKYRNRSYTPWTVTCTNTNTTNTLKTEPTKDTVTLDKTIP